MHINPTKFKDKRKVGQKKLLIFDCLLINAIVSNKKNNSYPEVVLGHDLNK